VTHPEHEGLVGEARGGRNRRDCSMPSSEETTWHGRLKTPQLNSLYTVTKSRTVITVVVTAWPREVSIAGGNGEVVRPGFRHRANWSRERGKQRLVAAQSTYRVRECASSRIRSKGRSTARRGRRARRRRGLQCTEGMRTSSSHYFLMKGYPGCSWAGAWAALVDSCWASCWAAALW
jgi:hypothetical protein